VRRRAWSAGPSPALSPICHHQVPGVHLPARSSLHPGCIMGLSSGNMALSLGTRLGHYNVTALLGEGAGSR